MVGVNIQKNFRISNTKEKAVASISFKRHKQSFQVDQDAAATRWRCFDSSFNPKEVFSWNLLDFRIFYLEIYWSLPYIGNGISNTSQNVSDTNVNIIPQNTTSSFAAKNTCTGLMNDFFFQWPTKDNLDGPDDWACYWQYLLIDYSESGVFSFNWTTNMSCFNYRQCTKDY